MTHSDSDGKEISNPFSTGGGGFQFESHVQASFAVLMLAGGFVPCLPISPITKLKFQGKVDGYNTDDLIVFMEKPDGTQKQKLLCQIKHSLSFTSNDSTFNTVIEAAWKDFTDDKLLIRRNDAIAVITGPLSATDIDGTRWILEWARSCETAGEFFRNVETAKFSSDTKRNKLAAFRDQVNKVNNGSDVSDNELFEFLQHFHILSYDLDIKSGVILSLMHSLINQYSTENVRGIWTQVVDEVQNANKNAGTLTVENMPSELRDVFKRQAYARIPQAFTPFEQQKLDLNQLPNASTIAIANLVGAWDESSDADMAAISKMVGEDFFLWLAKIQEALQVAETPLRLRNGVWHLANRLHVWQSLGKRVFDKSIDAFKNFVISILKERDPKFELSKNERFGATLQGKVLSYSRAIRKGVAETLALMGADPTALSNCSEGKLRNTTILALREILKDADYVTWGSLNELLPLLAQAAPEEFLSAVERDLGKSQSPFVELFKEESDGITGENYLTGLLWALESLAWGEQNLVQVCVLLSELAARDPGGQSGNRPFNSLQTILLPWLPQTDAPKEKRKTAIETVANEQPDIAWKLLLALLPQNNQISMRTQRPVFKSSLSAEDETVVSKQDYWLQINELVGLALNLAGNEPGRLAELAAFLSRLPLESISVFAKRLESVEFSSGQDDDKVKLWKRLKKFLDKYQKTETKSAEFIEALTSIEARCRLFEPKNPAFQFQQLFGHNDREFYDGEGNNWDEKAKQQEERRRKAIKKILEYGGIEAVREFIYLADEAVFVGHTLGSIEGICFDKTFLPQDLLSEDTKMLHFLHGFVGSSFHHKGWDWVDLLGISGWSRAETGKFLALLPFSSTTWKKVAEVLGDAEAEYWSNVNPNPYQATTDLSFAIDKLIDNNRPMLAVACLNRILHDKLPFDVRQAERALLVLLESAELNEAVRRHEVMKVINALQESPEANQEILYTIEWTFLPLIDRDLNGFPKLLERRLATVPKFFAEMVGLCYRSKKEPRKEEYDPTEKESKIASNAFSLLYDWQITPGLDEDGTFNPEKLRLWLAETRAICDESGHLNVALIFVGRVLFYSPADPDGLWIHRAVAEILNDRNADKLRSGFGEKLFNERGVHWVDPTGQEERDLAEKYRQMAGLTEGAGYQRFAASIRKVSEFYEREADRVIREAEAEKLEDENETEE